MTAQDEKHVAPLVKRGDAAKLRGISGAAWETIIGRLPPAAKEVKFDLGAKEERADYLFMDGTTSYLPKQASEQIEASFLYPQNWNGTAVLWLSLTGDEAVLNGKTPTPAAQKLLDAGVAIACPTLYLQGAKEAIKAGDNRNSKPGDFREFSGYTYGYNPTLLARRVHDAMTMAVMMKNHPNKAAERVIIVGTHGAGPVAAAATYLLRDTVAGAAVDLEGFRFDKLTSVWDINFVPGAVKYGDVDALIKMCAPLKFTQATGVDAVVDAVLR